MKKYQINETIQKQDGTKVYCINKIIDTIGCFPVVEQVFKGTKEECKQQLKELEKKIL